MYLYRDWGKKLRFLFALALFSQAAGLLAQTETQQPADPAPVVQNDSQTQSDAQAGSGGGPSLLSRGGFAAVRNEVERIKIRPYISASGIYDSSLGTVSVDADGHVPTASGYGVETRFGVAGSRTWKNTILDLDYRGSFRHYDGQAYYDGVDNSLNLSVSHQVSRHVSLDFTEGAAMYQRSFFLPASIGVSYDPLMPGLTGNEMYDSPTQVLTSMGRLTYQMNARASVSLGGAGFMVRRRSSSLNGVTGYMGMADVAYRLSRRQTLAVDYTYSNFSFTKQFGDSELQSVALDYSVRVNRNWELAIRGGGYRVHSRRLIRVELDPALAVFFGSSYGVERYDKSVYAPHYEARLTRGFHRGTWSLSYSRLVTPGNGVYLTSKTDSFGMAASYSGSRRVSLQAQCSYAIYSSLTQSLDKYNGGSVGAGASVRMARSLSLLLRADARRYDVGISNLNRTSVRATIGLAWSPGEYPLAIW